MEGKTKLIVGSVGALLTAAGAIIELCIQFIPEKKNEKAE